MTPIPGLQDIQGLDHISIWPLAAGWWILIGFFAVAGVVAAIAYFRRMKKLRSWQHSAIVKLNELEENLTQENSQSFAIQLSELIRRLAVHRYSRQECAGLKGKDWLQWLSERDPSRFDWVNSSRCVFEAPFSPKGAEVNARELRLTIKAAKEWVK